MKIPNTSVRVRACSRVGECGLHSNTPIIGQREFSAASVSSNHLLCIRAGTAIRLRSPSLTTCVLRSIVSSNDGTCSRRLYAHAHAHTHTHRTPAAVTRLAAKKTFLLASENLLSMMKFVEIFQFQQCIHSCLVIPHTAECIHHLL